MEVPEDYKLLRTVDLQNDKKAALLVNFAAIGISVVMIAAAILIRGIKETAYIYFTVGKAVIFIFSIIAYMVLHELTHGIFMRYYSGKKPKYGFTGLYAFAAADALFKKRQYIVIGLSPIVILGVLILALNIFLPQYFWSIYIIQILNVSGAAGDLYVMALLVGIKSDILVFDTGTAMRIYSKTEQ
ncbi:MAG: DUF3267 domain-containing protein [Oscillospiraceae bacterium]|nr:DUF3267 domain-containing protein [Oscillospiraceae bacterium]